jgi:ABC-2 type transport system ATP-binding protein
VFAVLEIQSVSRAFGKVQALDKVSFTVERGGMTGFIGGNGAGKTTTMRVVMGIISADAGQVRVNGQPITPADIHTFGYMPAERGLYPKMKVAKQLAYFAEIKGTPTKAAQQEAYSLLERLGLSERANDPVTNLSLGNQQRVQIAAALIGDPQLLIMDEPFSGLDPLAVDAVGEIMREYADRGVPILFSSHQLDLVERLCDHLVIIASGQIRAAGSRTALLQAHAGRTYEIAADGLDWLREVPHVTGLVLTASPGPGAPATSDPTPPVVRFAVDVPTDAEADAVAQAVLQRALSNGPVRRFDRWTPDLADVFREVIVDAPTTGPAGSPGSVRKTTIPVRADGLRGRADRGPVVRSESEPK